MIRIVLLAVLVGCSSQPAALVNQEEKKHALAREVREELEIGRAMSAKLLGHFGVSSQTPRVAEYVRLVGQNLAKQFGRPELNYRFAVVASDGVNAYAVPGGYVFVTRGLLKRLHSEGELASVLAHEMAHINQRHMYHQIRPQRTVSANESVVRLMSRGASDIGNNLFLIVQHGMKVLLEDGLGKEKELEADDLAVVMTAAAGYDATAYLHFLTRCQQDSQKLQVQGMSVGFDERVELVRKSLQKNSLPARADAKVLEARFEKAFSELNARS